MSKPLPPILANAKQKQCFPSPPKDGIKYLLFFSKVHICQKGDRLKKGNDPNAVTNKSYIICDFQDLLLWGTIIDWLWVDKLINNSLLPLRVHIYLKVSHLCFHLHFLRILIHSYFKNMCLFQELFPYKLKVQ